MIPAIKVARPSSVGEVLDLLSDEASIYCGGTELLLAMRIGLLAPSRLVDIKHVEELRCISVSDGALRIGGACTHAQILRDEQVTSRLPLLARIESTIGNPRVRSQGSIGGNLCFAEPKSDVIPGLIALGASVVLRSAAGSRTVLVDEFIEGSYQTQLGKGEILESISVPLDAGDGVHLKYQTMERPTVSVVIARRADNIRVVIGAAGDMPVWTDLVTLSELDIGGLVGELDPIEDLSGSAEYKRHVSGVYVSRARAQFEQEARR